MQKEKDMNELIVVLREKRQPGESLKDYAKRLRMPFGTVRRLWYDGIKHTLSFSTVKLLREAFVKGPDGAPSPWAKRKANNKGNKKS